MMIHFECSAVASIKQIKLYNANLDLFIESFKPNYNDI